MKSRTKWRYRGRGGVEGGMPRGIPIPANESKIKRDYEAFVQQGGSHIGVIINALNLVWCDRSRRSMAARADSIITEPWLARHPPSTVHRPPSSIRFLIAVEQHGIDVTAAYTDSIAQQNDDLEVIMIFQNGEIIISVWGGDTPVKEEQINEGHEIILHNVVVKSLGEKKIPRNYTQDDCDIITNQSRGSSLKSSWHTCIVWLKPFEISDQEHSDRILAWAIIVAVRGTTQTKLMKKSTEEMVDFLKICRRIYNMKWGTPTGATDVTMARIAAVHAAQLTVGIAKEENPNHTNLEHDCL
ncbi:unnamed protein product [Bemisia tabaci]|uniref:Uncharacterized protein n=1 Tax=Bemisia tabaci TaxID=7038 RepID=A0A9P0AD11_BEMTA|nr:unnamed protein product [Bemisia tabaci]